MCTEPVDEKTLRDKNAIMTNMWLLAQMKQPGRSICRDFDRSTFTDFLEKLFDKKNFNLHKEVNGALLLLPKWTDCMSYKLAIRKEAYRLCRVEGGNSCPKEKCDRRHICMGCGKIKPYDECLCFNEQFN